MKHLKFILELPEHFSEVFQLFRLLVKLGLELRVFVKNLLGLIVVSFELVDQSLDLFRPGLCLVLQI